MRINPFPGVLLLCYVCPASAQNSQTSVQDVIKSLKQEQKLNSAKVEGTEQVEMTPEFRRFYHITANAPLEQHTRPFSWAFKNLKSYWQYTEPGIPKGPNDRYELSSITHTEIYDGKQQFDLITSSYRGLKESQLQGALHQKPITQTSPLSFGYELDGVWSADRMEEGDFRPSGIISDPVWGRLEGYSEDKQVQYGTQQTRLWVSPSNHWVVVRCEQELDTALEEKKLHTLTKLNLEKVAQRDGLLFPIQGTTKVYGVENGQQTLLITKTLLVNSFTLNSVSDSLFEIKFQPGTGYTDIDTKEYFRIGPNGEKITVDLNGQERVPQRSAGWLFMLSSTTLLCLLMGFLWRKQKCGLAS